MTTKKGPKRTKKTRKTTTKPAKTVKKAPDALTAGGKVDVPRLCADLVLAGLSKGQVAAFLLAELNLRPGRSELDKLIEQAKADLADQADHYREIATELTVVRLNDLYTRALKVQDLKTALDVQRAIITFLIGKPAGRQVDPPAPAAEPAEPIKPRLVGGYADAMEKTRRRRA